MHKMCNNPTSDLRWVDKTRSRSVIEISITETLVVLGPRLAPWKHIRLSEIIHRVPWPHLSGAFQEGGLKENIGYRALCLKWYSVWSWLNVLHINVFLRKIL